MARLLTEDGAGALQAKRILVLCPDPIDALDVAERLERAGAEALTAFDLQQFSLGLHRHFPDGAIAELTDQHPWPSVAVALLHELAVPQVLGVTDRQHRLLRPKMPNALFLSAPLIPRDVVLSLSVVLSSTWPRLLRPHPTAQIQRQRSPGRPYQVSLRLDQRSGRRR